MRLSLLSVLLLAACISPDADDDALTLDAVWTDPPSDDPLEGSPSPYLQSRPQGSSEPR